MTFVRVVQTGFDGYAATCLNCAKDIAVPVHQLCQHDELTDLVCKDCGYTFQIVRDERHFPRTTVSLEGTLLESSTRTPLANLTITDLSLNGLCFSVSSYPHLQIGTLYTVLFRLNDVIRSEIQEDIVIRQLYNNQTVGAEFHPPDCYNFDLDFYLNPWVITYK
jgi:hypothetical protein